jgi:hypothetical protein
LIARLKPGQVLTPPHQLLRDRWFEIQVRSVLEHAWAEIEHEIVYKSGVSHPDEMLRRFASLAGTLELLDNEFLQFREERSHRIDTYVSKYKLHEDQNTAFDVARLLAFLEASRPGGRSWRQAAGDGKPFEAGLEVSCVEALKSVGLGTPASLKRMFRSPKYRYAVHSFAAANGIAPIDVSHLASVVLAAVVKDASTLWHHFPEMIYDPTIEQIAQRRAGQRRRR